MQTSAAELRYNLKDVMQAVERNESVTVLYHGKPKAEIRPIAHPSQSNVREHPFFAMAVDEPSIGEQAVGEQAVGEETVEAVMDQLRGSRY